MKLVTPVRNLTTAAYRNRMGPSRSVPTLNDERRVKVASAFTGIQRAYPILTNNGSMNPMSVGERTSDSFYPLRIPPTDCITGNNKSVYLISRPDSSGDPFSDIQLSCAAPTISSPCG